MNKTMVSTSAALISSSSSISPSSPNEKAISAEECVEDSFWGFLEYEIFAGFRVWQLGGIILSILLTITIALCCCIRFRVPRTKQEIEADYIRKRITRNFRKELTKIDNTEMDEMDLRRALDRVRAEFDAETEARRQQKKILYAEPQRGFRGRFNAIVHGMRARFTKNEQIEFNGVI